MRLLILISLVFFLNSCTKVLQRPNADIKKENCPVIEENLNSSGQRLPTGIAYTMPSAWIRAESTSSMKFEERIIDVISQAKIKVFYFEGMKGLTESNLQRWKNQFKQSDFNLEAQELLTINEIPVVKFKASGTYIEKTRPMDPNSQSIERPGHTMQAYILETQTGTWFFKAVAPTNVIKKESQNLQTLEKSFKEA